MRCNWLLAIFAILILTLPISIAACTTPAEFEVISLDVTPQVALAGDTISVAAEVKNIGQHEGSYSAVVNVDGVEAGTQTITLLPEASQKLVFSLIEDKAGSYQVSVGELSASFKIKEPTLEQLEIDYPELYQELLKLPELTEIGEEDNEAIREIAYLALRPEYKAAFESILDEGINDERKYCTPLQALLWIAYDWKFDEYNPLSSYSLTKLMNHAWKSTTTSNTYQSERWTNFEEILDRLNSPNLVAKYLVDNVAYDLEESARMTKTGTIRLASPRETFKSKKGVCNEQARFALYCLLENGYYYDGFELHQDEAACCLGTSTLKEWGHVTCLYIDDGLFYVMDTTLYMGKVISGPFSSIKQAADAMMPNWVIYEIADVGYHVKNQVRRH